MTSGRYQHTRYAHTPSAIRATARDLAANLVTIAGALDQRRSAELMVELDELTDAVLIAERIAERIAARYAA
jgi:hypothetical protein